MLRHTTVLPALFERAEVEPRRAESRVNRRAPEVVFSRIEAVFQLVMRQRNLYGMSARSGASTIRCEFRNGKLRVCRIAGCQPGCDPRDPLIDAQYHRRSCVFRCRLNGIGCRPLSAHHTPWRRPMSTQHGHCHTPLPDGTAGPRPPALQTSRGAVNVGAIGPAVGGGRSPCTSLTSFAYSVGKFAAK